MQEDALAVLANGYSDDFFLLFIKKEVAPAPATEAHKN